MTLLDDHDLPVVMAPAFVAAEVAMLAEFGTGAETVMVAAALDYRGFSAGNRRRRDGDRAKGCNNVSKLLHVVLLGWRGIKPRMQRNVPAEPPENSERLFSKVNAQLRRRFRAGRALFDDRLIHHRIDLLAIVPADRPGRRGQIHHRKLFLWIGPPVGAAGARPGELSDRSHHPDHAGRRAHRKSEAEAVIDAGRVGVAAIPKASRAESQQANLDALKLKLDDEDWKAITALPKDKRFVNPGFAPAWD